MCSPFDDKEDWLDEEELQLEEEETEKRADKEACLYEEECTGVEGANPTPKLHRLARDVGIAASISFGHYPDFLGICGPLQDLKHQDSNRFDFLSLLWPASLSALIAIYS